jgi:PST family polysaccharide transporter
LIAAVATSVTMALTGFGYWAIVAMTLGPQVVGLVGVWATTRWLPGRLRLSSDLRPLLTYGSTVTLNTFVVYLAYNTDKILLGRFWGVDALGLYSRAYQLINLPTDTIGSAISQVALPALARVQYDIERRRRYFVQGYGVFLTVVTPIAASCLLFGNEIVGVFLGSHWVAAGPIFRLLTPTMLVLALINPFGWLMLATGKTGRSLRMAVVIALTTVAAYGIGLHWGPRGVAIGFSSAMVLLAMPLILWAKHGYGLTARDIARQVLPPIVAAAGSGTLAAALISQLQPASAIGKLAVGLPALFGAFAVLLLILTRDRALYLKVLHDARLIPSRFFHAGSSLLTPGSVDTSRPSEVGID